MMIIDVRKLNAQKLYSGHMEFDYSAPEILIEIPFVKFAGPVKVSFDYDLFEDNALEIRGFIRFRLEGQCSRCLKEASMEVEGELDAFFEPHKDFEDYGYTNGVIHLEQAVQDAIVACMPFVLSCGEDCEGISYQR